MQSGNSMGTISKNTGGRPLLLNGREVVITDTVLQLRDRAWWKSPFGILGHIYLMAVCLFLLAVLCGSTYPLIARLFLGSILILVGIAMILPSSSVTTLIQLTDEGVLIRGKEFCERGALAFERGISLGGVTVFAVDAQGKARRMSVYGSWNPFAFRPMMEAVSRFWSLESISLPGDWPPPPRREEL